MKVTETKPRKNFLGIPVTGDIQHADKRVAQKPLDDLAPVMQAVLDDPTVASFSWIQYTPYFQDGDPCVFGVNDALSVVLVDDANTTPCASCGRQLSPVAYDCPGCDTENPAYDADYDEDESAAGVECNSALGKRYDTYNSTKAHHPGSYDGPDEARYDRCLALEKAICSGAFDDVLLEHFGDHCTVTVSRDGISVSEYSHE
jgi:hypothetical protein